MRSIAILWLTLPELGIQSKYLLPVFIHTFHKWIQPYIQGFPPVGTVNTNLTSIPSFQELDEVTYIPYKFDIHKMNTDKPFRSSPQPIRTNLRNDANIFTANHIKLPQKHWVTLTFLPSVYPSRFSLWQTFHLEEYFISPVCRSD